MKMRFKMSLGFLSLLGAANAFAACPAGITPAASIAGKEVCVLKGTISSDLSLTSDKIWLLSGGVYVGGDNTNSATLSIQPGTTIYGQSGPDFLSVSRGSKIMAEGAKDAPIVFTTIKTLTGAKRSRGDWGGLVLNGKAPINACGTLSDCTAEAEGGTGVFGGTNPNDSSGVLKYVRVEFSGYEVSPDNEINGITLNGVGSGTVIDFVQVNRNLDDGMEVFGGTVNVKHVVLSANRDDSLDWDMGWQGKAQFVLLMQSDDEGNNGIEADNRKSPMDAQPRSFPEISNLTLIGSSKSPGGENAVLLRRGTGAIIENAIITGSKVCLNFDDSETFSNATAAQGISFFNVIMSCAGNEFVVDASDLFNVGEYFLSFDLTKVAEPNLNGFIPVIGSPALTGSDVTPFDAFFDAVDFAGAVKDVASDWTKGWTSFEVE